jgi:RecA/RadA recombinase
LGRGVSVDPNLRAKIRAQIEADYGAHTILPGGKMPRPRRLPTLSPAFDYITGGGVPFRNITRAWGYYSSGKTTFLLKLFAAAQNYGKLRHAQLMGLAEMSMQAGELRQAKILKDQAKRERELGALSCLFVCTETFDPKHAEALGVDLKALDLITRTQIEDIGKIVYNSLLGYHFVGVDSTTATMSISEIGDNSDANDGDNIYGSYPMKRAAAWGINLDWWRARMSDENCLVLTSHAREKRTGTKTFQAQSAEHAPGGFALNHEPGLILHFMKGGALKRKPNGGLVEVDAETAKGNASASAFGKFQPAGGVVHVKCEKNKVGVAGRSVTMHHDKRTGDFDVLHEYEKFAGFYRVLPKSGTWWTLPDGTKTQQLRLTLERDADVRQRIESVVLRCAEDPVYEANLLAGRTEALVEIPSEQSV